MINSINAKNEWLSSISDGTLHKPQIEINFFNLKDNWPKKKKKPPVEYSVVNNWLFYL